MNRNSLENFREEAAALKVPQNMIEAAEKQMEKNVPKIEIFGQIPADRGLMDVTIHVKQSAQSDFYYFNKFDLAISKAKPLDPGHRYMVIGPDPLKKDSNSTKNFDSAVQAMDYFRGQKGNSELSIGKFDQKNLLFKDTVATMKEGKVDYVKKEFQSAYYSPAIKNSHYVDRGKGFSIEQAANMLQGRAVFREDMMSRGGEQYKAWSQYQFNEPKDKYGNYTMKQFSEGYPFDLRKELANYEIKELYRKETNEKLISDLQNGNRAVVKVMGPDGEDKPLLIEAVPKYGNINFFDSNGKPQKREDFLSVMETEKGKGQDKDKDKDKEKSKESVQQISI